LNNLGLTKYCSSSKQKKNVFLKKTQSCIIGVFKGLQVQITLKSLKRACSKSVLAADSY